MKCAQQLFVPLILIAFSAWATTSGSLDGPLTQLYFGRAD
jgi:hypothetical protein